VLAILVSLDVVMFVVVDMFVPFVPAAGVVVELLIATVVLGPIVVAVVMSVTLVLLVVFVPAEVVLAIILLL